ncbi:hypothetical protein V1318_18400 [Lysobacter sp. CCNWLW3]|uniref:hypothetical protein n=1 Tax=unclassified Lysobacter TaxID=2635362 RepID=UPI002FD7568F
MNRGVLWVALIATAMAVGAYCFERFRDHGGAMANPAQAATRHAAAGAPAAGRSDEAAAQPVSALPGAAAIPLRDAYAQLRARAEAGDVAAATRLYRNVGFCSRLPALDAMLTRTADELLAEKPAAMSAQQLRDYKIQLDAIEERKPVMQRFHELCGGASEDMLASLVPSIQRAAELGDVDARACYLKQGPNLDPRSFATRPELLDGYRRSVKSLIDSGMAAGDWKVVDIVRNASRVGSESLLSGLLGSDPALHYRYLKLYRLGMGAREGARLDLQLDAAAASLSPAQRMDADVWAQTALHKHFSGHSAQDAPEGWDPCGFSYE